MKKLGRLAVALLIMTWSLACTAAVLSEAPDDTKEGDAGSPCGGSFETAVGRGQQELEQLPQIDLWFADGVGDQDRQEIRAGLGYAQIYLTAHYTAPLPAFTCFDIRSSDAGPVGSGRATGNRVLIITAPEGWPIAADWALPSVVAHEYVHVWQLLLAGEDAFQSSPVWLIEGMSQWMSLQAMVEAGLLPREELECRLTAPRGFLTPHLAVLETPAGWRTSLMNYQLSLDAVNQLVGLADAPALQRYLAALGYGQAWQDAFHDAFGRSPAAFYAAFDPADVRILSRQPAPSLFAWRWGSLLASRASQSSRLSFHVLTPAFAPTDCEPGH